MTSLLGEVRRRWRALLQTLWPEDDTNERLEKRIARRTRRLVALRLRIERLLAEKESARAERLERRYQEECMALEALRSACTGGQRQLLDAHDVK